MPTRNNPFRSLMLVGFLASLPTVSHAQEAAPPPAAAATGWTFAHFGKANGTLAADGDALIATVTAVDGTGWHVQMHYSGSKLTEGHTYTLHFRAKADTPRAVAVSSQIDGPDYHNIGLDKSVQVDTDWKDYGLRFTVSNLGGKPYLAPEFFIGDRVGKVWLSDVSLAGEGADAGQSQALAPDLAAPPPPDLPLAVTRLKTPYSTWDLLRHGHVSADIARQQGVLVIHITKSDGVGWHVQMGRPSVPLHEGQSYTIRFRARADAPHNITLVSQADSGDYHNVGLDQTLPLKTDWRDYQVFFIARGTGGRRVLVPMFSLGEQTGTVWLSNIIFAPIGGH